jgi:large subunit ribosomal protein L23
MAVIEEKKENIEEKKVVKKAAKKEKIVAAVNAEIAQRVLVEPWITEKSHAGVVENKYSFKVSRTATKGEIKKAIEGYYKVKVAKIGVINIPEKKKSYGRYPAKKAPIRKAVITLKQGDKIELFHGA